MRHRIFGRKLGRDINSRKALIANLAASLVLNERIQTTEAKAKTVKPVVDKLITQAKKQSLSARRRLASDIGENAAKKAFDVLASRYLERQGGYVRSFRLGKRLSDSSEMMMLELVDAQIGQIVQPVKVVKKKTTPKVSKPEIKSVKKTTVKKTSSKVKAKKVTVTTKKKSTRTKSKKTK
ncbi:MAG TPA: 50S ribosomal protein L17 [Patescibacteria group bacterium]